MLTKEDQLRAGLLSALSTLSYLSGYVGGLDVPETVKLRIRAAIDNGMDVVRETMPVCPACERRSREDLP